MKNLLAVWIMGKLIIAFTLRVYMCIHFDISIAYYIVTVQIAFSEVHEFPFRCSWNDVSAALRRVCNSL